MDQLVNAILVPLVLTGFLLLSSSRLAACIRAVAIQGMLLGILAIAVQDGQWSVAGVLFPFLVLLEELPNYLKPLAEVAYHTGWQQRRSFR